MSGAIPPLPVPTDKVGFCLEVPDNVDWFGLVTGALLKLSYGYYWDKDVDGWEDARDAGKQIVYSWLNRVRCDDLFCSTVLDIIYGSDGTVSGFLEGVIARAVEQCTSELATAVQEGIEALVWNFDVRVTGCVLEKTEDGGETWTEVGDFSECGAVGPQGEQGEQGIQGEQGEQGIQGEPGTNGTDCDNCQTSPDPVGEDGTAKKCSVARGVTLWLFGKFNDGLDLIAELIALDRAVLDAVSDIIEAIPVVGNLVEFTVDLVENLYTADITALRACDTEDFRDEVYCKLFCALGDDGIITDEILATWADDVQTIGDCSGITMTIGDGLKNMIKAIGGAAFRQRGFIYSNGSEDCPSCPDCPTPDCFPIDWVASDGGYVVTAERPYGDWVTSVGWQGEYTSFYGAYAVHIYKEVTQACTIISLDVDATGSFNVAFIRGGFGGTNLYDHTGDVSGISVALEVGDRVQVTSVEGTQQTLYFINLCTNEGVDPFG